MIYALKEPNLPDCLNSLPSNQIMILPSEGESGLDLIGIISELRSEHERIGRVITAALVGGTGQVTSRRGRPPGSRRRGGMSEEGRRRVALAMKSRWAEIRAKRTVTKAAQKARAAARKRGGISAAGRKRLSELMKKRWAARKATAKAS